ncbi:hypothetical protein JB92DRAFT_2826074 [Gautieria morchelliformis]|nr:hypothetical protein JB92DRAFT_2826074 [Gautieria morchelliformis]
MEDTVGVGGEKKSVSQVCPAFMSLRSIATGAMVPQQCQDLDENLGIDVLRQTVKRVRGGIKLTSTICRGLGDGALAFDLNAGIEDSQGVTTTPMYMYMTWNHRAGARPPQRSRSEVRTGSRYYWILQNYDDGFCHQEIHKAWSVTALIR